MKKKMKKIKNYNDFLNEGIFDNILGKVGRGLSDWAMAPLKDMMKDVSKSGDPKKIINSLKIYVQKTGESLKKSITSPNVKTVEDLNKLVVQELVGLSSALKGIQATQKVNKTFFDEIFKNANKDLVKVMGSKTPEKDIPNYVNDLLKNGGGLFKLANYELKESTYYNNYHRIFEADDNTAQSTQPVAQKPEQPSQKPEQPSQKSKLDPGFVKLKDVTYKWLVNILQPIIKSDTPKESKNGTANGFIEFGDEKGHKIDRSVAQGIIKKAGFKQFKQFRDSVGDKNQFPL